MNSIYIVIDDDYRDSLFTIVFSSYEKALSKLIQSQTDKGSCNILIRCVRIDCWDIMINDKKYTIRKMDIDERKN